MYDEVFDKAGSPRPLYRELIGSFDNCDLGQIAGRASRAARAAEVTFGGDGLFWIDPIPRLIEASEWETVGDGLTQRAAALNRFIADAYGDREIVAAGEVPARVIDSAALFEPGLQGLPTGERPAAVIGFDLIRSAGGGFQVLEDNLRTPSGMAYAAPARAAVDAALPSGDLPARLDPSDCLGQLWAALRDAAPAIDLSEEAALVSDGPESPAFFEHRFLAERLGLMLVTPRDLEVRGGVVRVRSPAGGAARPLRLIYRRTSTERLADEAGAASWLAELTDPIRGGELVVVNSLGSGVGDDKLSYAYVDRMIRFYLGEEPILPSIPTYDLGDPAVLAEIGPLLGSLVVKPRAGMGGHGVVIGPRASASERELVRREVYADPGSFVAQEMVELSTHPTVCGGRLRARHVDLRAYVIGDVVGAAALTRVALDEGELVVNSSQNGGAKDTWLLRR
jgi:uncharacterized circularly permuted ATP-grasp superfamily protein